MFSVTSTGSFAKTRAFIEKMRKNAEIMDILHAGGLKGVLALRLATPVNSGLAAASWYYEIEKKKDVYILNFLNSDVESGFPVAVMLQFGYGTGSGGYVEGNDYINPAMRPIFDEITQEIWKVVTSA